jgi:hypothetical protein
LLSLPPFSCPGVCIFVAFLLHGVLDAQNVMFFEKLHQELGRCLKPDVPHPLLLCSFFLKECSFQRR